MAIVSFRNPESETETAMVTHLERIRQKAGHLLTELELAALTIATGMIQEATVKHDIRREIGRGDGRESGAEFGFRG